MGEEGHAECSFLVCVTRSLASLFCWVGATFESATLRDLPAEKWLYMGWKRGSLSEAKHDEHVHVNTVCRFFNMTLMRIALSLVV
jgi:hypothetical protein